jgi:hypothetical protein
LIVIECGIICFLKQAIHFYRARKRPRLDAGLRHAAVALAFLSMSAALAPIVLLRGISEQRLDATYVVLGALGGLALYVVGQFYKIVPFLAWISRFRNDIGKKRVPTVAELYSQQIANIDLLLFIIAIGGIALGILTGAAVIVRIAAMLLVAGVSLFASQMIRVAFGTSVRAVPTVSPNLSARGISSAVHPQE